MIALQEGTSIGPYVMLAPLPVADGDLWLARSPNAKPDSAPLVVRALPPEVVRKPDLRQRVVEEARVALAIEYPHLVRLIDIVEEGASVFIVSEFVSGRTLRQILHRAASVGRVPPIWFTLHVAAVVAQVLAFVHARCGELGTPLTHVRHIVSPDSILVSFAGDPRLWAFGFAQAPTAPTVSHAQPLPSCFGYVAPEQLGHHEGLVVDLARSDVYSLGVVLYEALTGGRPFQADDSENLLCEVLDGRREPKPPSRVAPWVTQPLEAIVLTAMAHHPTDRFRHAGELGQALEDYMAWAGVHPARKHVAAQVVGMVHHPDSEPPPSARSRRPSSSSELAAVADPCPTTTAAPGVGRSRQHAPRPLPAVNPRPRHSWDRAAAGAREAHASGERATVVRPKVASPEHSRGSMPPDATVEEDDVAVASSTPQAVKCFEAGLDLVRVRDYEGALVQLQEAVRLDPENRVYRTNLRRVKQHLASRE